jgi:hypothetical protein
VAESYSERHGRKPPISVEALVELVFRRLRDFEKRDYFYEAFHTYIDPAGDEHPARLPHPEEYLITHLARPGLWDWLGDLERVVDERDFPPWDFDTLFDVIELFHNLVVAAPSLDFDGTFEGWWSQPAGQREFREAINEILELSDPPTRLTEDGRILETGPAAPALPEAAPAAFEYDVFLSHAHEDKDAIVRPLAQSLSDRGYRVFVDEDELVVGDDLHQRLAEAMTHSRVGVVILSPTFFAKNWTQYELGALLRRESSDPASLIIPIWHGVDAEEVRRASPQLADRLALSTDAGLPAVVRGIERALQRLGGGQAPVPAAGTDAERHQPAAARLLRGRRIPIISWLRKHDRITVGDYIAIAFIAAVLAGVAIAIAAALDSSSQPVKPGHSTPRRSSTQRSTQTARTTRSSASRQEQQVVIEYADDHRDSPVYAGPPGNAVGVPTRIPYGTRMPVSCVAPNQSGTMPSVHGLYLIAGGRWRHEYVVADTMSWETVGATTTPNIDPRVRPCRSS